MSDKTQTAITSGRLIEVYGPPSVGKSTFLILFMSCVTSVLTHLKTTGILLIAFEKIKEKDGNFRGYAVFNPTSEDQGRVYMFTGDKTQAINWAADPMFENWLVVIDGCPKPEEFAQLRTGRHVFITASGGAFPAKERAANRDNPIDWFVLAPWSRSEMIDFRNKISDYTKKEDINVGRARRKDQSLVDFYLETTTPNSSESEDSEDEDQGATSEEEDEIETSSDGMSEDDDGRRAELHTSRKTTRKSIKRGLLVPKKPPPPESRPPDLFDEYEAKLKYQKEKRKCENDDINERIVDKQDRGEAITDEDLKVPSDPKKMSRQCRVTLIGLEREFKAKVGASKVRDGFYTSTADDAEKTKFSRQWERLLAIKDHDFEMMRCRVGGLFGYIVGDHGVPQCGPPAEEIQRENNKKMKKKLTKACVRSRCTPLLTLYRESMDRWKRALRDKAVVPKRFDNGVHMHHCFVPKVKGCKPQNIKIRPDGLPHIEFEAASLPIQELYISKIAEESRNRFMDVNCAAASIAQASAEDWEMTVHLILTFWQDVFELVRLPHLGRQKTAVNAMTASRKLGQRWVDVAYFKNEKSAEHETIDFETVEDHVAVSALDKLKGLTNRRLAPELSKQLVVQNVDVLGEEQETGEEKMEEETGETSEQHDEDDDKFVPNALEFDLRKVASYRWGICYLNHTDHTPFLPNVYVACAMGQPSIDGYKIVLSATNKEEDMLLLVQTTCGQKHDMHASGLIQLLKQLEADLKWRGNVVRRGQRDEIFDFGHLKDKTHIIYAVTSQHSNFTEESRTGKTHFEFGYEDTHMAPPQSKEPLQPKSTWKHTLADEVKYGTRYFPCWLLKIGKTRSDEVIKRLRKKLPLTRHIFDAKKARKAFHEEKHKEMPSNKNKPNSPSKQKPGLTVREAKVAAASRRADGIMANAESGGTWLHAVRPWTPSYRNPDRPTPPPPPPKSPATKRRKKEAKVPVLTEQELMDIEISKCPPEEDYMVQNACALDRRLVFNGLLRFNNNVREGIVPPLPNLPNQPSDAQQDFHATLQRSRDDLRKELEDWVKLIVEREEACKTAGDDPSKYEDELDTKHGNVMESYRRYKEAMAKWDQIRTARNKPKKYQSKSANDVDKLVATGESLEAQVKAKKQLQVRSKG
jgi:hypothetical protein